MLPRAHLDSNITPSLQASCEHSLLLKKTIPINVIMTEDYDERDSEGIRNFRINGSEGLQPLDKCLNKPFKTRVRAQYQAWMVNGPFTYTPSGKKRVPSKELVLQWVNKAWQEIPAELVIKSFKSYGISNALDGTEDDAIYGEESESGDARDADDELDNEFDTDSESEDE